VDSSDRSTALLRRPIVLRPEGSLDVERRATGSKPPIPQLDGGLAALVSHDVTTALPFLGPIAEQLECGFLLVVGGRIVLTNEAFATMVGLSVSEIVRMGPTPLARHIAGLVDQPPEVLLDGCLFSLDRSVLCEEFELARPMRSVVRWVARPVMLPGATGFVATCTDITTEVDLAAAQERLARTDTLTGLVNRRGMHDALERERARGRRAVSPTSVLIIDVDHFKKINDVHGHAAGDLVLRQVAKCVTGAVRASDAVARWGGEEFLVLLPDTPIEGAKACAENIRAKIEAMRGDQPVTVSIGCAQFGSRESTHAAIARADERLYQAKATGRNRVG
jgi:diguanylate cyclase (GGDEF)-like protein